jgi:uncharacterized protein YegP (UPF0339 family)
MTGELEVKLEIYEDAGGEWRWRAKAANGEVVADGGEGYENRVDCAAMAEELFPGAEVSYLWAAE